MFGLVPWRKEEERAWPVGHPLAELNREFRTLANRLFTGYPTLFEEMNPERLWNVAVDETEKEFVVKMECLALSWRSSIWRCVTIGCS